VAKGGLGPSTRERGAAQERAAERFLSERGYDVVARNVHAAGAELDLIVRAKTPDGTMQIVFVEVRSRSHELHGSAVETVGPDKRRRVIRAAKAWLVSNDLWDRVEVRFDVIGVVPEGDHAEIEWIPAAFDADARG